MFNEKALEIYEANKLKGFWDEGKNKNFAEIIALIHSELSEALEAHRKNYWADRERFNVGLEIGPGFKSVFEESIKSSVEDEIADTIIRLLDTCGGFGIDIDFHIEQKLKYNSLRPYKHGKKY